MDSRPSILLQSQIGCDVSTKTFKKSKKSRSAKEILDVQAICQLDQEIWFNNNVRPHVTCQK